jgi:hypothetical protein
MGNKPRYFHEVVAGLFDVPAALAELTFYAYHYPNSFLPT